MERTTTLLNKQSTEAAAHQKQVNNLLGFARQSLSVAHSRLTQKIGFFKNTFGNVKYSPELVLECIGHLANVAQLCQGNEYAQTRVKIAKLVERLQDYYKTLYDNPKPSQELQTKLIEKIVLLRQELNDLIAVVKSESVGLA